jgi:SMI1-KNR4 cell-wall
MTNSIWDVPAYLPYVHETVSAQIVKDAENKLEVSLPRSYVKLLSEQNGGYVRLVLPDSTHSMIWGIGPRFPSITETHNVELKKWARRKRRIGQKALALVPFDGDGHWYLCFDYRTGAAEPQVTFIDLETEEENVVAVTFDAFLSLLQLSISSNAMGIVGHWTVSSVAHALGGALGASFDDQGSYAHGYPVLRCSLGDKQNSEWCWISPNEVPRGFVREDDERFKELSGRMSGLARRFPESPEVVVEISCTDGVRDRVLAACKQSSVQLVALTPAT